MGSSSWIATCPNCGESCDAVRNSKPFDHTNYWCYNCGFTATAEIDYMDLEQLNDYRADSELAPLKKLPEQKFRYGN